MQYIEAQRGWAVVCHGPYGYRVFPVAAWACYGGRLVPMIQRSKAGLVEWDGQDIDGDSAWLSDPIHQKAWR